MILTVERKKKFLITMMIIMGCAIAINFGLYNVLSSYFKSSDYTSDLNIVYMNMLIVVITIMVVTVIMIVLIPKDTVNQMIIQLEQQNGTMLKMNSDGNSSSSSIDQDEDDDGLNDFEEQQLNDMIDEDFYEENNSGNKK